MNKFESVRTIDTEYAYALGVIRTLETRLLTLKDYENYISSRDLSELKSALHDSDYGYFLRDVSSKMDYEEALDKARESLYNQIEKLMENDDIMGTLRARFDFHNTGVLLKSKIEGTDHSDLCSTIGSVDIKKLKEIFEVEKYSELPAYLEETIEDAIEAYYTNDHDPLMLNMSLDRSMAEYLTSFTENEFLKNYYRIWVDTNNLEIIIRLLYRNSYEKRAGLALLPGGNIEKEKILACDIKETDDLNEVYKGTIYSQLLGDTGSFSALEKSVESLLVSYLDSISFESIGVEPIIVYLFRKENEIRNLRMIIVGMANEVEDSIIKERLIL